MATAPIIFSLGQMDVMITMRRFVFLAAWEDLPASISIDSIYAPQVGDLCFRISAYPETYASAQLRCEGEGSTLAFIPSKEIQESLEVVLTEKVEKYSYFSSLHNYWLGAFPNPALDDWSWHGFEKPLSGYANWKARRIGCLL